LGPDSSRLYVNQATPDYFGFTLEEWQSGDPVRYVHPEDRERFRNETRSKFLSGVPHETEMRFLGKDGKYRWFLYRWNPLRDEQGRLIRWYVAATDIEDRRQAEQRLQNENVALREEIDKASMLEEVVGTSRPLHSVLSVIFQGCSGRLQRSGHRRDRHGQGTGGLRPSQAFAALLPAPGPGTRE